MKTGARSCGLLVSVAILMLAAPRDLAACSCVADIPLCESFWAADVVFEGEVTAVEQMPASKGVTDLFAQRRVQFAVTRVWRGQPADSIDVMTGSGGGDCGYGFRKGRKYLVYAAEHEGRLTTNICSPTKPLDRAAQDLEYLQSATTSNTGGRIYGTVRTSQGQPVSRYTVVLRGAGGQRIAVTKGTGEFEFTGMPPGEYTIRVIVHDTERGFGREDVNLRDARACAKRDFTIEH